MSSWRCPGCQRANPSGTRFCGHCGAARNDEDTTIERSERRLVTMVFADLSGFTSLAEERDPEEVADIVDPVLQDLASVVDRHGGFVDRFAGDAVIALFGAPVAHGQDADHALRAALEMHQLVESLDFGALKLALHVGINSGHVVARSLEAQGRADYSVVGDAANVAARLESLAKGSETLIGDVTRDLLWESFDLEDAGWLSLKGKREPVRAWRLVAAPTVGLLERAPFAGRAVELTAVLEALREIEAGTRPVVTIEGEAGSGKSRLASEAASRIRARRGRWIQWRARPELTDVPYGPLREGLERVDPGDAGAEHAAEALSLLTDASGSQLLPEARRRRIHAAVGRWLGADRSLVLGVDDGQWLDSSTAALVADMSTADVGPGAIVAGFREAGPLASWLAGTNVTRVEMRPLADDGVAALAEGLLGAPAPPDLLEAVTQRGLGNPFYVTELIRSLVESRALQGEPGSWRLDRSISHDVLPLSVEAVVAGRVDRVSPAASEVLRAAAVLGQSVSAELVRGMVDPDLDVDLALKELAGDDLLREEGAVVEFCHPLVHEVVHRRLLQRVRRRMHRSAADLIEASQGVVDETVEPLARHRRLAGDADRAVPLLARAAQNAARVYANAEAIDHLRHAVDMAPAGSDAALELLVELARLLDLTGAYGAAADTYTAARDGGAGVDAWAGLAATMRRQGRYDEALELLTTAMSATEGADQRRLWLERSWACSFTDDLSAALDAAAAGLALDGETDAVSAHLRTRLAYALTELGEADRAVDEARTAVATFDACGDLDGRANALLTLGGALEANDELDRAASVLAEGIELAERIGSVENLGGCLLNLGFIEHRRGRLAESVAHERRALHEFEVAGHRSGLVQTATNLAENLLRMGELEEASVRSEQARSIAEEMGFTLIVAANLETQAQIMLAKGDAVAAGELAQRSAQLHLADGFALMAQTAFETAASAWDAAGDEPRATAARQSAAAAKAQAAPS